MTHEVPSMQPESISLNQVNSGALGPLDASLQKQLQASETTESVLEAVIDERVYNSELLDTNEPTFPEIMRRLGAEQDPKDGRIRLKYNQGLFEFALQDKGQMEAQRIYGALFPDWKNLQSADAPTNLLVQRLKSHWYTQITDSKERERIQIIDALGESAGMAAHSERVGYNVAHVVANYIFLAKRFSNKTLEILSEQEIQQIQEEFNMYQFSLEEQKLIANAGLAGLLHDIGKGKKANKEEQKLLQQLYRFSSEEVSDIHKYMDILVSPFKRTSEQETRIKEHTEDGETMLREAGLPIYYQKVAAGHHTYEFQIPIIDIYGDENGCLTTLITILKDGGDAATSIRTYKFDTPISHLENDRYNITRLMEYRDITLFYSYILFVRQLDAIVGNTFQKFKENVRQDQYIA